MWKKVVGTAGAQDLRGLCVTHITLTREGGPRGMWSRTPEFSQVTGRQTGQGSGKFCREGLILVPERLDSLIPHTEEVHFCHPRGNMTALTSTEEPLEARQKSLAEVQAVLRLGSCSHRSGKEKWRWLWSISVHSPCSRRPGTPGSTMSVWDPLFICLESGHTTCLLPPWRLNEIMYQECLEHWGPSPCGR